MKHNSDRHYRLSPWRSLLSVAVVVSCTTAPVVEPVWESARDAWTSALSSGDSTRIWAMLGSAARARFEDEAAFAKWCLLYCPELLVDSVSVRQGRVSARFEDVELMKVGGVWAVENAPGIAKDASPNAALRQLRAVLARLMASQSLSRAATTSYYEFIQSLDKAAAGQFPVGKKEHRLTFERGTVRLVVEKGLWKIAEWSVH